MAPPNHEPSDIESKPQGPTLDELFEIARRASLKRRLRVTLVVALYVLCGFSGTVWYAYSEGKQNNADGVAPLTAEETHLIKVRTERPGGREVPNHDRPRSMAKEQPSAVVSAVEPRGASKNAREVASVAAEAKGLRELLARIEAERKACLAALRPKPRAPRALEKPGAPSARTLPAPDAVPDPPASVRPLRPAHGRLVFPAQGRVVRQFNEKTAFGARSKGITIETLAAAQIIAPHEGRVVFSGPFRDYGQLLIIEHGGGYHTLLAGLHRIDSVTSQWLLAGEPVGVMTRPVKGNPRLYIELRRNGRPINPLPWLAPPTDKASG